MGVGGGEGCMLGPSADHCLFREYHQWGKCTGMGVCAASAAVQCSMHG